MPYVGSLGDGLLELRFHLITNQQRISFWITPDQRIVLLTVFRKTKQRERAEVERAHRAHQLCRTDHGPAAPHNIFTREIKEEQ